MRTGMAAIMCLLLGAAPAAAHPHVWIMYTAKVILADGKATAIEVEWSFDEYFSATAILDNDSDGNKKFDAKETERIQRRAFSNLGNYNYLSRTRLDGKEWAITGVTGFAAEDRDGSLIYRFTLKLPQPVAPAAVDLAFFDESFFIDVAPRAREPVAFAGPGSEGCSSKIWEDAANAYYHGMITPIRIRLTCPGV